MLLSFCRFEDFENSRCKSRLIFQNISLQHSGPVISLIVWTYHNISCRNDRIWVLIRGYWIWVRIKRLPRKQYHISNYQQREMSSYWRWKLSQCGHFHIGRYLFLDCGLTKISASEVFPSAIDSIILFFLFKTSEYILNQSSCSQKIRYGGDT